MNAGNARKCTRAFLRTLARLLLAAAEGDAAIAANLKELGFGD
jgi:hypothetical protein